MMSVERAKEIINCYGGHSTAWPEQEKDKLQQLLVSSKMLRNLQQQALDLDKFLGFSTPTNQVSSACDVTKLHAQIMAGLPQQEQPKAQLLKLWLNQCSAMLNKDYLTIFRPVLLFASVVFLVVWVTGYFQFSYREEAEALSLSDYMVLYVEDNVTRTDEIEELEVLAFLEPQILEDDN